MTRAYANLTLGLSEIATAVSNVLLNIAHSPGFVEIDQHPLWLVGLENRLFRMAFKLLDPAVVLPKLNVVSSTICRAHFLAPSSSSQMRSTAFMKWPSRPIKYAR
jgi:hypothetical protein